MAATVVLACLAAVLPAPGEPRPSPAKDAPPVLEALGRQYLDAGLPLPPADAPLTVAPSGSVRGTPSGGHRDLYALGFQTEAAPVVGDGSHGTLLMGAQACRGSGTRTSTTRSSRSTSGCCSPCSATCAATNASRGKSSPVT